MKRKRSVWVGGIFLITSFCLVLGLYQFSRFWMSQSPGPMREIFVEVNHTMSPVAIAKELESQGIISNARMFYWYGRLTGKISRFKAGDYRFTTSMKPDDVMAVLVSGISFGYPITIPEGYSLAQIAEQLEKMRAGLGAEFLQVTAHGPFVQTIFDEFHIQGHGVHAPRNLEGFLFPDTYLVTRKSNAKDFVRQMVRKYRRTFDDKVAESFKSSNFTEWQLVTLASVVEKETGAPDERPKVASVFLNRLIKGMKLQSDPTVIYGIKNYSGNITKKDLLDPHPYNTYVHKGLPVGPIANPGLDSLLAVLRPAKTDYLYFVSHNDGTHQFSKTYEEHREAVNRFQVDRRAREGHSWRELNKKM